MSLVFEKHKFDLESVMVPRAKVMMVKKDKRFMLIPTALKKNLNEAAFSKKLLSDMNQSATMCREQTLNSNVDINILVDSAKKPVDGVDLLKNINRIAIRRDGKTVSIAQYVNSDWDAKIYPRYGLEDGIYTPNIGRLELPNVFGHIVLNALQAKDNINDWKKFIVLCFDQYIQMISTHD